MGENNGKVSGKLCGLRCDSIPHIALFTLLFPYLTPFVFIFLSSTILFLFPYLAPFQM